MGTQLMVFASLMTRENEMTLEQKRIEALYDTLMDVDIGRVEGSVSAIKWAIFELEQKYGSPYPGKEDSEETIPITTKSNLKTCCNSCPDFDCFSRCIGGGYGNVLTIAVDVSCKNRGLCDRIEKCWSCYTPTDGRGKLLGVEVDISCANRDFCDRIEKRLKESNDER